MNFKPEVVFVDHAKDIYINHVRLHEAVVTASHPIPGQPIKQLLIFVWQLATNGSNRVQHKPLNRIDLLTCLSSGSASLGL